MTRPHEVQEGLASLISRAFTQATFDLSARPGADEPGWAQLPECLFATALEGAGEPASFIRGALTLIAAMDRSRAAVNLWRCALTLHERDRWAFVPTEVAIHSLTALTDALRESGVSQRHLPDAAAWRRIAELLLEEPVSPVARVISEGIGDAVKLLDALGVTNPRGTARFPFLGGPKVGPMWIRIMVYPGGSRVTNMNIIPVAVDVQVRRVTEYLGVTDTLGLALEDARGQIQNAWIARVADEGAEGPGGLAGTCGALDPALWYFGRVGCSWCESRNRRVPIATVCTGCILPIKSVTAQNTASV